MPTRHAKLGGVGGSLGSAIRNERFEKLGYKMARNLGEKDAPKNAHMVIEWETLDEEAIKAHRAANTSVTDENDLTALMTMADLAGRDFTAERQNVRVIFPGATCIGENKLAPSDELKILPIPKRPSWTKDMSVQKVDSNEKEAFLQWRRELARIEESYDIVLTPFEKNLEFWRQLWRVVEKSDVVVQVVDSRNPLLYRCEALETYVREVGPWKGNVLLFNKADLLPLHLRVSWGKYLDSVGIKYFFFAARSEIESRIRQQKANVILEGAEEDEAGAESGSLTGLATHSGDDLDEGVVEDYKTRVLNSEELLNALEYLGRECVRASGRPLPEDYAGSDTMSTLSGVSKTSSRLQREYIMIGFVGYPNVGKSSTINALLGQKRVGVTSTPGKTKHFQTMIVSDSLMLCDCPGLVFPSVVSSRAEMVCGGILPLNTLKDHIQPMELVCRRIPRVVFEETYNIVLPSREAFGGERVYVTWVELCQAYAVSRGLITGCGGGIPDTHTAARKLLTDYVNGRLRFCHAPPGETPAALGPVPGSAGGGNEGDEAAGGGGGAGDQLAAGRDPGEWTKEVAVTVGKGAATGGVGGAENSETGVAIGVAKKGRRSRENRGLSAGVWAEDQEAGLFQTKTAGAMVAGRKKGGSGAFTRVERPYSTVPVRPASAIPMAQKGEGPGC